RRLRRRRTRLPGRHLPACAPGYRARPAERHRLHALPLLPRGTSQRPPPKGPLPNGEPPPWPNGSVLSPPVPVLAAWSGWLPSVTSTVFWAPPWASVTVSVTAEPGA